MKFQRLTGCAAVGALLAACAGGSEGVRGAASAGGGWRAVATAGDRERLRQWRDAWIEALGEARTSGKGAEIAREGPLFLPDRALEHPVPPAGDYRCRVFKLGALRAGAPTFTSYPFFECRVDDEGEVSSFHKRGGSQRPVGIIFADTVARAVFLGTLVLGDEKGALDYGRDATRDMIGVVERIGERRWRLVLPYPRVESKLDVIELVPAG